MQKSIYRLSAALILSCMPQVTASTIFINEFHYDNTGGDLNEGIEIAAPSGTDLSTLQLLLYNGANGLVYAEVELKGIVADQDNGFGTVFFAISGMQNGPDGIALATTSGSLLQFLSYEGAFVAVGGVAAGVTSTEIGVVENPDADPLMSLQLTGSGMSSDAFTWVQAISSRGMVNVGQVFTTPVPLPGAMFMMISALGGLFCCRRNSASTAGGTHQ